MKESSSGNEVLPRAAPRSRIGRNALWSSQEAIAKTEKSSCCDML